MIAASAAGCARDTGCLWVKEINPAPEDMACMSRKLKVQIEVHDETLEKNSAHHWWQL